MKKADKSINFYAAYKESLRAKKSPARWLLALIPMLAVLAVVVIVSVFIRMNNLKKNMQLSGVERRIQQLDVDYQSVTELSEESASLASLADELQVDASVAEMLPVLDENLFVQVNACAAGVFTISTYRYDEETRMLEIDASAPSVNDVPELVEALRDTALFSSVQYVGYTSDTDGVYYCTVGCVLNAPAGMAELVEAAETAEEGDAA